MNYYIGTQYTPSGYIGNALIAQIINNLSQLLYSGRVMTDADRIIINEISAKLTALSFCDSV